MGVSPFTLFIRKQKGNKALKGLTLPARGKAVGKLYKALPAAEKAALVKAAKAAPSPKITKIRGSVRVLAKAVGLPFVVLRKNWFIMRKKMPGATTVTKLRAIARANKIVPRRIVHAYKKPAKTVTKATKKTVKK